MAVRRLQGGQEFLDFLRRVLELCRWRRAAAEIVCGRVEEIRQETVWMENFDIESSKNF